MDMRRQFVTKSTNIFYKDHNIHIESKLNEIVETDEKMNNNSKEGDKRLPGAYECQNITLFNG